MSRAVRPRWAVSTVAAGLVVTLLAALAVAVARDDGAPATRAAAAAAPVPVPAVLLPALQAGGLVPWSQPLVVAVRDGELSDAEVTDPDGGRLPGQVDPDGTWRSARTLVPAATYLITAVLTDAGGDVRRLPKVARTTPAERIVHARVSPGDDAVVGVGMPVVVDLDLPVERDAERAALERRLTVTSEPRVEGSWRWMSSEQLHWRPAEFWPAGTKVRVRADLHRLELPDGTWGSGIRTSAFTVGSRRISTVDVAAKTMTVSEDGKVLRVLKASMGNDEHPTLGGTHLVLEKNAERVMDSDTVGLPGEYRTRVEWAVRLTYSGTFTHSAPWSVKDQGVRNVSHGCINLSPADARWFYDNARRGDVVTVVNAAVGPRLHDPGSANWNLSYDEWKAGSALG